MVNEDWEPAAYLDGIAAPVGMQLIYQRTEEGWYLVESKAPKSSLRIPIGDVSGVYDHLAPKKKYQKRRDPILWMSLGCVALGLVLLIAVAL